jgi:hypothetical protein
MITGYERDPRAAKAAIGLTRQDYSSEEVVSPVEHHANGTLRLGLKYPTIVDHAFGYR